MTEHENVNAAVHQLNHALTQVIGERPQWVNNTLTTRPSRYAEMQVAASTFQRGRDSKSQPRSMPPISIEATAWLQDTQRTLDDLPIGAWTVNDLPDIHARKRKLTDLVHRADQILEPTRHNWDLVAACPACLETTVYRQDDAGDNVRRTALTLTANGCECLACHAKWSPEYFQHLARVLGCALPAGVLE